MNQTIHELSQTRFDNNSIGFYSISKWTELKLNLINKPNLKSAIFASLDSLYKLTYICNLDHIE